MNMEGKDNTPVKENNEEVTINFANLTPNTMSKQIESQAWNQSLTVIDLSGRNIAALDNKVMLPANLVHLNLSHNKLCEVSKIILDLEKLVVLNVSHNTIQYFDECPGFCHTLELLDMSYNNLAGPPYWIWSEAPQHLIQLDLRNNPNFTKSFENGYFEELLQYNTPVTEVNIQNCRLSRFNELLGTFHKAKSLCLGADDYTTNANSLIEVPSCGLDKCCDLRSLNVCNTHIYTINPSIEMYKNLVEINLAQNNLSGVPNEFCNLENLEICTLSCNKILYLPDDIHKMHKLCRLYLDSNEICMLPDTLSKLLDLKTLDLYDNHLNCVPMFEYLEELDLALNYFEEPNDCAYLDKKEKLRLMHENRYNGRKNVIIKSEDDYNRGSSCEEEDDEELNDIFNNEREIDTPNCNPPSSPEDWDSDDYWVPWQWEFDSRPSFRSQWVDFVNQKMKEGNFCPMDIHPVSVVEKLRIQRLTNPIVFYESDGQFDDYSSDDS